MSGRSHPGRRPCAARHSSRSRWLFYWPPLPQSFRRLRPFYCRKLSKPRPVGSRESPPPHAARATSTVLVALSAGGDPVLFRIILRRAPTEIRFAEPGGLRSCRGALPFFATKERKQRKVPGIGFTLSKAGRSARLSQVKTRHSRGCFRAQKNTSAVISRQAGAIPGRRPGATGHPNRAGTTPIPQAVALCRSKTVFAYASGKSGSQNRAGRTPPRREARNSTVLVAFSPGRPTRSHLNPSLPARQ